MSRLPFDNAATSYPKPPCVWDAVDRWQRESGAAVGRGSHRAASAVHSIVTRCRRRAAELLGVPDPNHVVFTFNGTDSLNLALHGLLVPGDHVVTTVLEHNSVLRPLRMLHDERGIEVTIVVPNANGIIEPTAVRAALQANTRLVAVTHASNVTGVIQPVADIGQVARDGGALLLVDAAQTAGHIPTRLTDLNADLLACPGHKGLLGPLGTGILVIADKLEPHLRSVRQGGTGTRSEDDSQPDTLPDKYESGTHNTPGLVGLDAALGWIVEKGLHSLRQHEVETMTRLLDGLREIPGIALHGVDWSGDHPATRSVGVVSFTFDALPPQDAATILDEHAELESRAGLHCAPGAHRFLGTFDTGGTVRLSPGPFTTSDQIETALAAIRDVAAG
ncbi:MAG: aminotransferase class V-fold PLP-dependent enzyme [Planctomycetaceae bacterium]|nr:aminotransferase class V-fold PLP-dependent enzyme [Planctomycetaceae bacterium]